MRALAALGACLLAGGCATAGSRVTLLDGEAGAGAGAVVVLDPATGAERGELTAANTQAVVGGKSMSVHPAPGGGYDTLLAGMPPPPQVFTLYFIEGTTTLTAASGPTLDNLRQVVTPASDVQITGHTDTVGDSASNDRLSLDRAVEIRAALVKKGLPVASAKVTGRGERELRVPTRDGVNEPANRRVEVILR